MPEHIPCARRAIDLRASGRSVVAWLEDDFHHFGVELRHDGEKVVAVDGQAARFPRDTCPGAVDVLQEVVGMPLDKRATALGLYTNMRMHCTHLYDLLGLAIAHAACGREHRRYEAMVPDREALDSTNAYSRLGGRTAPQLYRDGQLVMSWEVQDNLITGPAPYAGISMGRGFREWTETLEIDHAEAAHVLRRAVFIALGRLVDLQSLPPEAAKGTLGVCHSFQPEVMRNSSHIIASSRDYSNNPQGLLLNLE
jgi:Protein of unknown function (DUF2889)